MDNNKISIKDVARLAGVSPTTVSRVINKSEHPVNVKTREVVEAAIEKLNFEPNRLAQGLINNKSNIIGVIVHDISDPYFAEILKGIKEVISDRYIVNIYNTFRDIDKELRAVNMLRANKADAVVFTGGSLLDDYYRDKMNNYIKTIEIGNKLAAQMITDYLINLNHRKIAYINGPEILGTTMERLAGYKNSLINHGLSINNNYIIKGNFSFEGGRRAALELLSISNEITAVVAANDETALGLIWELKNKGLDIPGDISVVGIGNIPMARYSYPPLTTISLPIYKLGVQIGEYIIDRLCDEQFIDEGFDVEIGLVERNSVKEV